MYVPCGRSMLRNARLVIYYVPKYFASTFAEPEDWEELKRWDALASSSVNGPGTGDSLFNQQNDGTQDWDLTEDTRTFPDEPNPTSQLMTGS